MRQNKKMFAVAAGIMILSLAELAAQTKLQLRLQIFSATRGEKAEQEMVTTSYFLQHVYTGNLPPAAAEKAGEELKRVFNLPEVKLVSQAFLTLVPGEGGFQKVLINGSTYTINVVPRNAEPRVLLWVGVDESAQGGESKNLLDTELTIPAGQSLVMGFRDLNQNSYFIVLNLDKLIYTGKAANLPESAASVVKPRLTHMEKPKYPDEALRKKIEGVVVLEATTDRKGNVSKVSIIQSVDPLLDEAARQAVAKWKYEPYLVNGQPQSVCFTVTVSFRLKKEIKNDKKQGN